jgi:hypothetical protein
MSDMFSRNYYMDGCLKICCKQFVWGCPACDQVAHTVREEPHQQIKSTRIGERYVIDCNSVGEDTTGIGPDAVSGHKILLVVVDHFTCFIWAEAFITKEAKGIAWYLYKLFLEEGIPEILHSDNGSEFMNHVLAEVASLFKLQPAQGRPYNPQCQGKVERENRTLNKKLASAMLDERQYSSETALPSWVLLLPAVVHARNITPRNHLRNLSPWDIFKGPSHKSHDTIVNDSSQLRATMVAISQSRDKRSAEVTLVILICSLNE